MANLVVNNPQDNHVNFTSSGNLELPWKEIRYGNQAKTGSTGNRSISFWHNERLWNFFSMSICFIVWLPEWLLVWILVFCNIRYTCPFVASHVKKISQNSCHGFYFDVFQDLNGSKGLMALNWLLFYYFSWHHCLKQPLPWGVRKFSFDEVVPCTPALKPFILFRVILAEKRYKDLDLFSPFPNVHQKIYGNFGKTNPCLGIFW